MFSYQPPLKDIEFVLSDLLDAPGVLSRLPRFSEVDGDLMRQVAEEAGRFAGEVLFPLNAVGDREGCRYEGGSVTTPPGFAQAYRQFCEAGWPALPCDPEYGGQGLPNTLNCVLYEMLCSANHAWTMFPGLLHGAYSCLHRHASDTLRQIYLPRIVSGEWLATMCLTEPQAGSDLGLLRTRAAPQPDGSARITGSKIFISGGEHDLSDNIVHLVLARLPDAPAGSKGISLFLVPKFLPLEDGSPGRRNAVSCTGIEHKMGIHGSATCSMQFDDAVGWLVGEPHRGLAAMFVMMNSARLHVGVQGVGLAETAYQNALAYAQERLQMRAAVRPGGRKSDPADPIVMHPAVQRLLMTQRAYVEGGRMLAYWTALQLDAAEHHPDEKVRAAMGEQLALITPVAKAMLTDQGFQGASQALQIYGGHGYIAETGIEQYLRDSRIAMLYEGTNEIQAVDLLLRKIIADGGARLERFLAQVEQTAAGDHGPMARHAAQLAELAGALRERTQSLAAAMAQSPDLPYRVAPEVLRLVGHCALAWLWLQAAATARARHDDDPVFHQAKQETADYYFVFVLPETRQLLQVVDSALEGSASGARAAFLSDVMRQYADQADN